MAAVAPKAPPPKGTPPQPPPQPEKGGREWPAQWGVYLAIGAVVLLIVSVLLVFWKAWIELDALWRWLITAGLMVIFLWGIGIAMQKRPAGVFIDSRFKISLSRLQLVMWTVLVLSAFITLAVPRAKPDFLYDIKTLVETKDTKTLEELRELSPDRAACFPEVEEEAAPPEGEEAAPPEGGQEAAPPEAGGEEVPPEGEEEAPPEGMDCTPDPLGVEFPGELLAALGISTASLAGSVLVKGTKLGKEAAVSEDKAVKEKEAALETAKTERDAAKKELGEKREASNAARQKELEAEETWKAEQDPAKKAELENAYNSRKAEREAAQKTYYRALERKDTADQRYQEAEAAYNAALEDAKQRHQGLLRRNTNPSEAKWSDLFEGEEIGNWTLVDMSKVQMFFFTIVIIFAYGAALWGLLRNEVALRNPLGLDLPSFSAALNGLLGISHAGYLTVKTVDHTKVQK